MARYATSMLPFAAAVAAAFLLSTALPASAAESAFGAGEVGSMSARAVAPGVRHRTVQRIRFAASRDHRRDRYVRATQWGRDCSNSWCGSRQFVLMIGIGY